MVKTGKMNKHIIKNKDKDIELELQNGDIKKISIKTDIFIISDGYEIETGEMFMENEIILN